MEPDEVRDDPSGGSTSAVSPKADSPEAIVVVANQEDVAEGTTGAEDEKPDWKRPRTTGQLFDPSSNPTTPKPLSTIEVIEREAGLRIEDRKLFNVLLALIWDQLVEPRGDQPFRASAADLRRAVGRTQRRTTGGFAVP